MKKVTPRPLGSDLQTRRPSDKVSSVDAVGTAGANDFRDLFGDGLAIADPEGLGVPNRTSNDGILLGGSRVGMDEN